MFRQLLWGLTAAGMSIALQASNAATDSSRLALVIGNAAYEQGPRRTALNDAGLVAEALNSVGFAVLTGADLSGAELQAAFRDFISRVEAAGPDVETFVYFSGYGVDYDGENYLIPIGARLRQVSDIPIEAVRVADLVRPLGGTVAAAKVVALDAGRKLPFPLEGRRVAPGLAASDAQPRLLLALSCEPGTATEDGAGPYGPYAMALAEMIVEPGAQGYDSIFINVRKRTYRATQGRQIPWHVSALTNEIVQAAGGPPDLQVLASAGSARRDEADAAFASVLEADSLSAYASYAQIYPNGRYTPRISAALRTRREALTWLRVVELNRKEGYWTYLARYREGPHAGDAARRLQRMSPQLAAPQDFTPLDLLDVPPPVEGELSESGTPAAQSPPETLIGPPPVLFASLRPPSPPAQVGRLPSPGQIPLAKWVHQREPLTAVARDPPAAGTTVASAALVFEDNRPSRAASSNSTSPAQANATTSRTAVRQPEPTPSSMQPSRLPPPTALEESKPLLTVPLPAARPPLPSAPTEQTASSTPNAAEEPKSLLTVPLPRARPPLPLVPTVAPSEQTTSSMRLSRLPSSTPAEDAKSLLLVPLPRSRPPAVPTTVPPPPPRKPVPPVTQDSPAGSLWSLFGAGPTPRDAAAKKPSGSRGP